MAHRFIHHSHLLHFTRRVTEGPSLPPALCGKGGAGLRYARNDRSTGPAGRPLAAAFCEAAASAPPPRALPSPRSPPPGRRAAQTERRPPASSPGPAGTRLPRAAAAERAQRAPPGWGRAPLPGRSARCASASAAPSSARTAGAAERGMERRVGAVSPAGR